MSALRATGTTVLGTAIHALDATDRATVVVSDLHISADRADVVEALRGVLRRASEGRKRVLVLGDLFDSYVTPRQLRVGVWREVAGLFAEAVGRGAEVFVLHGNRDFLLGEEWERATGSTLVCGGLRTAFAGVDTLFVHGDELCLADLPYQRAKRWLRGPLVRAFARSLPVGLALRVAARARQKSRMVIAYGDQGRFLPTAAALDAVFATGVGALVFGHVHRRSAGAWGSGSYFVLPAFDEAGVHLEAGLGGPFVAADGTPLGAEAPPLPCQSAPVG